MFFLRTQPFLRNEHVIKPKCFFALEMSFFNNNPSLLKLNEWSDVTWIVPPLTPPFPLYWFCDCEWWTILIQVEKEGGCCSYKAAAASRGESVEVSEPGRRLTRGYYGLSSRAMLLHYKWEI